MESILCNCLCNSQIKALTYPRHNEIMLEVLRGHTLLSGVDGNVLLNIRGGEWYLEKRGSRKIFAGSRNLGSVLISLEVSFLHGLFLLF